MEADPDLPLLRQIATGDHDALEALYQRHGLKLLNFLIGFLHDRTAAEDALQHTMLAIWQGASAFRAERLVKTWRFAIARRQAEKTRPLAGRFAAALNDEIASTDEANKADSLSTASLQAALRRARRMKRKRSNLSTTAK